MLARISMLFLLLAIAAPLSAGERIADIQVETEKVADGIYLLRALGGNIGAVVGDDGIFLVDDQYAPLTPKIRAALEALPQGEGKQVRFVLNTHFHGDHTGGNENLGKAGAVIVAHDNVRARMTTEQFRENFLSTGGNNIEDALPVVTFNDRVTFHLNGHTLETHHYPHAHTDGDSVVWFRERNVVHMGDLFFDIGYPFIDTARGGSVRGLVAALDDVLSKVNDSTVILPGHGEITDKAGLQAHRDTIVELRDAVLREVKTGKSLEAVQAMQLSKPFDERWSWEVIDGARFIETLYNDLAATPGVH